MPILIRAICFVVAIACFLLETVKENRSWSRHNLIALGLAFFVAPFAWDALEAL